MFNPWVIVAEIGVSVGLHYLNEWLSDPPPDAKPNELANLPQTTEGTPVPLVFGKCRVHRPALIWFGGFRRFANEQINGDFDAVDPITGLVIPNFYGINLLFNTGIPHTPIPIGAAYTETRLTGVYFNDKKMDLGGGMQGGEYILIGDNFNPFAGCTGQISFFDGSSTQLISDNTPHVPPDDITEIAIAMCRVGVEYSLVQQRSAP